MDQAVSVHTMSRAQLLAAFRVVARERGCGWTRGVLNGAGVELPSELSSETLRNAVRMDT